jgi:hypothetical protein
MLDLMRLQPQRLQRERHWYVMPEAIGSQNKNAAINTCIFVCVAAALQALAQALRLSLAEHEKEKGPPGMAGLFFRRRGYG